MLEELVSQHRLTCPQHRVLTWFLISLLIRQDKCMAMEGVGCRGPQGFCRQIYAGAAESLDQASLLHVVKKKAREGERK